MEKDTEKTKVIFYNERINHTVLAVFPELPADFNGYRNDNITCYSHVGQHSEMGPEYVKDFEMSNEGEQNELFHELESMGYNLETTEDRIRELSKGDLTDEDIEIIMIHMEGVEPFLMIDREYIKNHVDDFYEFRDEYTELSKEQYDDK